MATLPPLHGEDGRLLVALAADVRRCWREYRVRGLAPGPAGAKIAPRRARRGQRRRHGWGR